MVEWSVWGTAANGEKHGRTEVDVHIPQPGLLAGHEDFATHWSLSFGHAVRPPVVSGDVQSRTRHISLKGLMVSKQVSL